MNNTFLSDMNPAPGVCLPIIVKFCDSAPYNYTVFPNYIGHFGQLDAEEVCKKKQYYKNQIKSCIRCLRIEAK